MWKIRLSVDTGIKNLYKNFERRLREEQIKSILHETMSMARARVISRFDKTAKGYRKKYETDPKHLGPAIKDDLFYIPNPKGVSVGYININKLPWYWEIQEKGQPAQHWQQEYYVVGFRKKASHRGDYLVLSSDRQKFRTHLNEPIKFTLRVSHKDDIEGRGFIEEGVKFLRKTERVKKWVKDRIKKSFSASKKKVRHAK